MSIYLRIYALVFVLLLLSGSLTAQQNLTVPEVSPFAEVVQTIGLTDLTVTYHRPAVNGRVIWGDLLPFGEVWRAGANENTIFSTTDPLKILGNDLAAGSYGFHILLKQKEWIVIFSNMDDAWGSFSYDENEDALRVTVTPQEAPFCERLIYYFDNPTASAVDLVMHWEKLMIRIPIEVDVPAIVLDNMRRELRGLPGFYWQAWNQAANYALQNDLDTDEALGLVDRSISMDGGKNFSNYRVKADLLAKKDQNAESADLMKQAMQIATEAELNNYGYQLLFSNKTEKAIEIFKLNTERYPDSWNTFDSLGEAYQTAGNTKKAIELYTKARSMTDNEDQKKRIDNILKKLKSD